MNRRVSSSLRLLDSVRALPGVRSASADGFLPFAGIIAGTGVQVEGRPDTPRISIARSGRLALLNPTSSKRLGYPLLAAERSIASEAFQATGNVVISQAMAQTLWPNENPIGKRVTIIHEARDNKPSTVIGVVGDIKHAGLSSAVHPTAYWAYPELGFQFMTLVIRTDGDPRALIPALRQTVLRIDKNQPIADVVPMETLLSISVARTRFATEVMAAFAFIAFFSPSWESMESFPTTSNSVPVRSAYAWLSARNAPASFVMLKQGMALAGLGIGSALSSHRSGSRDCLRAFSTRPAE